MISLSTVGYLSVFVLSWILVPNFSNIFTSPPAPISRHLVSGTECGKFPIFMILKMGKMVSRPTLLQKDSATKFCASGFLLKQFLPSF
jgi:hypothetical protein